MSSRFQSWIPGLFGSKVQLTESLQWNLIPVKVSTSTVCCNGRKNRLPGAKVKIENWIFCFVFLAASSLDMPAADDAVEIQCDRQASATKKALLRKMQSCRVRVPFRHSLFGIWFTWKSKNVNPISNFSNEMLVRKKKK